MTFCYDMKTIHKDDKGVISLTQTKQTPNISNDFTALILPVKFGLHTTTFPFLTVQTVGPSHSGEKAHEGDVTNNDVTKEKPHPNQVPSDPSVNSDPRPTYTWTKSGHTECSTTCGTGEETHRIQRRGDRALN